MIYSLVKFHMTQIIIISCFLFLGRIASDLLFNCDVWLGLTTDIPGWIDNAPLVYFNWAPGKIVIVWRVLLQ